MPDEIRMYQRDYDELVTQNIDDAMTRIQDALLAQR